MKQAEYQDGHAGYSDPLDEQAGIVNTINAIESSKYWSSTAIVLAYDDSDGWYDHQAPPNVNSSSDPAVDALDGTGQCGSTARTPLAGEQDRCGYGPRTPLLVISPYAKSNYVDHSVTDQSSVLSFIEQNWSTGLDRRLAVAVRRLAQLDVRLQQEVQPPGAAEPDVRRGAARLAVA